MGTLDGDLKKGGNSFFKRVIQAHGLHLDSAPNPMFDADTEDYCNYVFRGSCNSKCARRRTHVPPTGDRKRSLLAFRGQCLCQYNTAKGPDDPDFQ